MRYLEGHHGPIHSLSFAADGRLLSGGKDGAIKLWDLATGISQDPSEQSASTTSSAPGDSEAVASVVCHPSQLILAWGRTDGTVCRVNALPKRDVWTHQERRGPVTGIAFVNNGRQLVVAYSDREVTSASASVVVINSDTGKVQSRFDTSHAILAIAAAPLGKRIAWGGGDRRLTVAELTAQDRWTSLPQSREVRAIALSRDETRIAVADDYTIRLHDEPSRRELRQLNGHQGRVDALAFTHDCRNLVSGAWDKTVRVWDVESGSKVTSHDMGIGNIRTLTLARDGLIGAAAGDRGIIALWDLN